MHLGLNTATTAFNACVDWTTRGFGGPDQTGDDGKPVKAELETELRGLATRTIDKTAKGLVASTISYIASSYFLEIALLPVYGLASSLFLMATWVYVCKDMETTYNQILGNKLRVIFDQLVTLNCPLRERHEAAGIAGQQILSNLCKDRRFNEFTKDLEGIRNNFFRLNNRCDARDLAHIDEKIRELWNKLDLNRGSLPPLNHGDFSVGAAPL